MSRNCWAQAREPGSRDYGAHAPKLPKPVLPTAYAWHQGTPLQREACALQLEKAYEQQPRPSIAKTSKIIFKVLFVSLFIWLRQVLITACGTQFPNQGSCIRIVETYSPDP